MTSLLRRVTQAAWQDADKHYHRIPVWNPAPPLDTPGAWATAVLSPNNIHTSWGMYSTTTSVYVIPPPDGAWTNPNLVTILIGNAPALIVNGPDVTIDGLKFPVQGLRLNALAVRTHIENVTVECAQMGVGIFGQVNPIAYGSDHLIEDCVFRDNGSCIREGDAPPVHGQGISWNLIKTSGFNIGSTAAPILVNKALSGSETGGLFTSGGATNTVVQDCVFDGTFDGASHYAEDTRFDPNCDTNLTFRRCTFANHADDALDRSRYQNNVIVEDCMFWNVGTVLSVAPLWGTVTLRRCEGSRIGNQVRIPDGNGKCPAGSIVKCGGVSLDHVQGTARIDDSTFWSDNPTSQGVSQDGGIGSRGPKLEITNSVIRAGYIAVNWPYPASDFLDQGNIWATSSSRLLKTALPIHLTPVAEVDARYYDPGKGNLRHHATR